MAEIRCPFPLFPIFLPRRQRIPLLAQAEDFPIGRAAISADLGSNQRSARLRPRGEGVRERGKGEEGEKDEVSLVVASNCPPVPRVGTAYGNKDGAPFPASSGIPRLSAGTVDGLGIVATRRGSGHRRWTPGPVILLFSFISCRVYRLGFSVRFSSGFLDGHGAGI